MGNLSTSVVIYHDGKGGSYLNFEAIYMKIETVEQQGYSAYVAGVPKTHNPFNKTGGISAQNDWLKGWCLAERDRNR